MDAVAPGSFSWRRQGTFDPETFSVRVSPVGRRCVQRRAAWGWFGREAGQFTKTKNRSVRHWRQRLARGCGGTGAPESASAFADRASNATSGSRLDPSDAAWRNRRSTGENRRRVRNAAVEFRPPTSRSELRPCIQEFAFARTNPTWIPTIDREFVEAVPKSGRRPRISESSRRVRKVNAPLRKRPRICEDGHGIQKRASAFRSRRGISEGGR